MTAHNAPDLDPCEAAARDAFATARTCARTLRQTIILSLPSRDRLSAQALCAEIDAQTIFEQKTVNLLDGVIETVSTRIDEGTKEATGFVADEHHIDGGALVTYRDRTPDAEILAGALPDLCTLRDSIHAVQDLIRARRVVQRLEDHG